jgi:hypothetical protein
VETKIVSEQLGNSTTRITEDLYQHVSVQMQIGAAETVVALLPQGTKDWVITAHPLRRLGTISPEPATVSPAHPA